MVVTDQETRRKSPMDIITRDGLLGDEDIATGTVASGKSKGMSLGVLEGLPAGRPSRIWN